MPEDEAIVRARYPSAESKYNDPVRGADLPHDKDGHWAIYSAHELGAELLGRGPTEDMAWADAANNISSKGQP